MDDEFDVSFVVTNTFDVSLADASSMFDVNYAEGSAGAVGSAGPAGPQGPAGATGAQGPAGPAGATGAQGPAGADGTDGAQGPAGADGAQGPTGPAGTVGNLGLIPDVTITNPVGGEGLVYDAQTSQWVNLPVAVTGSSVRVNGVTVDNPDFLSDNTIQINVENGNVTLVSHGIAFGSTSLADATATGNESAAYGGGSHAAGEFATALGTSSTAEGIRAAALGPEASAGGPETIAVGYQANATNHGAMAIGEGAVASGEHSIAIGAGLSIPTQADSANTIALGAGAKAVALSSIAIGDSARAGDQSDPDGSTSSIAIGSGATAHARDSIAIGRDADVDVDNRLLINNITTVRTPGIAAQGNRQYLKVDALGNWSVVEAGGQVTRDAVVYAENPLMPNGNSLRFGEISLGNQTSDTPEMARVNFSVFDVLSSHQVHSTVGGVSYYAPSQSALLGAYTGSVSRIIKPFTVASTGADDGGYVFKTFHYDTNGNLIRANLFLATSVDFVTKEAFFGDATSALDVWSGTDNTVRTPVAATVDTGTLLAGHWTGFDKAAPDFTNDKGDIRLLGVQRFTYDAENRLTNSVFYARTIS